MLTIASPPRMKPTSALTNEIRRREIPEVFMSPPASTNSGIASIGKPVAPL
jgi:hypothetical protein